MNNTSLVSYEVMQQLLDKHEYLVTVAEIQGLLMGFYSAGLQLDDFSWKTHLVKQLSVSEPIQSDIDQQLMALNSQLCEMITSELFGLDLLMPIDTASSSMRGEALGYWCQGFLMGYLQITENKEESDEDVADALADLEEIANIDLDSIGNTEEDERSLFEITEHIKISAQIIHSVNGKRPMAANETLH